MTIEQKLRKPAEAQVARKAFAGREGLASGLHHLSESDEGESRKIFSAHVVKEMVMTVVSAVKAKNAYEALVVDEARAILEARKAVPEKAIRRSVHDLSGIEGVLGAALEGMGVEAEATLLKKGNGDSGSYCIFIIKSGESSDKIMVKESVMSEADPVAAAQKLLRLQGIGVDRKSLKPEPANKRRSADLVELAREDLDSRKIIFHGSEDGGDNHFTYTEEGMESSVSLKQHLKGEELLRVIDNRIVQLHSAYNRRLSSQVAEAITGAGSATKAIEAIQDPSLRIVARTIHALASVYNEPLVPEEYAGAYMRLKGSQEFYEFNRNVTDGVVTKEEIEAYRSAYDDIDHPGHRMVRTIVRSMAPDNRDLTDDEKEILRSTIALHSNGSFQPKVLETLAEAYALITNEDVTAWDDAKRAKMYLKMSYTIRKAVLGLGNCLKVISDEEAREESIEF